MVHSRSRSRPVGGWPLALFVVLAAAAGCGSDDAPAPTAPPPPEPPPVGPPPATLDLPDDAGHFFLEVWEGPAFVPIEYLLGRPPQYALTVGGELFYEGPTIAIFPGPLLPNIQQASVSEADLAAIIEATAATGVSQVGEENIPQPESGPIIADIPATEIYLRDQRGLHLLRVDALASSAHTDPRVAAIRDLMALLDRAAADTAAETYSGERVQVYVSAGAMLPDPSVLNDRPWPLPDPPPPEEDVEGFECRVYEGQVAADLLEIFADANHGTRWDFEGTLHQLLARSLLPREEPCVAGR